MLGEEGLALQMLHWDDKDSSEERFMYRALEGRNSSEDYDDYGSSDAIARILRGSDDKEDSQNE